VRYCAAAGLERGTPIEREAALGLGGSVAFGANLALLWHLLLAPSFAASGQELLHLAQPLQAPSQNSDAGAADFRDERKNPRRERRGHLFTPVPSALQVASKLP
jgi:hypothetical protein